MTLLEDQIIINVPPDRVFNWFNLIHEHYQEWHPDHVVGKWIVGDPFEIGSILYVEEYMHGSLHKMKFETTEVRENQLIKYKLKFPTSLICSEGAFIFEPSNGSCLFTASLNFRFGWLVKVLLKSRYMAFKTHMREESVNLKKILETKN
ncbi:MAG: SRPBCC family protein [Candidatus Kariarchaeaceae archaeon]|jgi:hypothetical protein